MIPALAVSLIALAAPPSLRAAIIQAGDVTNLLGPTFFLDEATNGGVDTDINQPGVAVLHRSFNGLLAPNQGPTRVVLTGFGLALHTSATANDATSVAVAFTYLGADEAVGGSDDVVIGTATGNLNFTGGGEYVFAFDSPLTANLNITGTRFRITTTPSNATSNGSLKIKSLSPSYAPYVSVAGVASATINPQRVNLAKYQTVTAGSVSNQRLASYVTDGVVGNDNRWQSENWAYNTARIDFPFPVEIGSAQVFSGVDDTLPLGQFGIQYLNGSTWTTIAGADIMGNTNVERNLVFITPITANSFRLIALDAPIRLRELALYPPNGPTGFPLGTDLTLNLAYQRPTVASANTAGNFALNAVDGRASANIWQTDTAGTNTLDIDLRVSTKIGSAHLYSGLTGGTVLADFVLKYWDGAAWQNIPGGTVANNSTSDLVVSFTTPVTTTKVRLEFTNAGTTSIRELCIFPANTGSVGYPIGTNLIGSGEIAEYETFNDAFYLINNPSSGRRMSVPADGQPALDPPDLTFGQSQYQVLLNLSSGTYRLRNRASGNCLSGARFDKTPGLPLIDAPYSALPHQDWILDPLGGGAFQLINQWSGLAIDSQGGATAPGTPLVQNTANGSATQRWQISKHAGYPKKGIGGTTFAMATNPDWAYNWGRTNSQTLPVGASFHPMQWGNYSWDIGSGQGPIWQEYPAWRKRADGIHLLGFNEPDGADQSNIPVNTAVTLWPRMQSLDMPLVSPAPASTSNGWLDSFYTQADALGYRVDCTAVHTYPGPSGGSSNNLISFVNSAYTYNARNRPVWLTEFSFVDWGGNQSWSEEDNYNCLAEFLWRAESVPALRKYALFVFTEDAQNPQPDNTWQSFTPAPRSNSYDINGNLTAFGKLYAGWDGDATVRTDKTYYIHHKFSRKRIANLTTQSNLSGRNIRVDGNLVHWTLVSAGAYTPSRYYVVSSLDGRRLSRSGTTVSLVAAGTTGTAVEWLRTESVHGWHYLEDPISLTRLRLVYNNSNFVSTYSMAASGSTGDDVQWRFIVPVVNNTAPVLAAIPPQTVNEGGPLTFTASATDADLPANTLTYSLIGEPVGASIHGSTGIFTWTPTEAQGPGSFNFSVRVSDGTLTHDQPVSVTVESPLPSSGVDSDGDGLSDLLEYAFVTDPGIPNGNPFRVIGANTGTVTLEFPWNWQATGLSWQIRHGHDLSNTAAWPMVAPGTTTTVREGNIDRITVAPAMAHPDRGFYVLEVMGN